MKKFIIELLGASMIALIVVFGTSTKKEVSELPVAPVVDQKFFDHGYNDEDLEKLRTRMHNLEGVWWK